MIRIEVKKMLKKAEPLIGNFCDDLETCEILPAQMIGPIGSFIANSGREYKFTVVAEHVEAELLADEEDFDFDDIDFDYSNHAREVKPCSTK